jgi:hypothetical protein
VALHHAMWLSFMRRVPDPADAASTIEHYPLLKPSAVATLFAHQGQGKKKFKGGPRQAQPPPASGLPAA